MKGIFPAGVPACFQNKIQILVPIERGRPAKRWLVGLHKEEPCRWLFDSCFALPCLIEGREPDAELLVLQERVIRGELTIAQALVLVTPPRGPFDAIG